MPVSEDESPHYTVRLRPRAVRDLDAESVRLAEQESDAIALDWLFARCTEQLEEEK